MLFDYGFFERDRPGRFSPFILANESNERKWTGLSFACPFLTRLRHRFELMSTWQYASMWPEDVFISQPMLANLRHTQGETSRWASFLSNDKSIARFVEHIPTELVRSLATLAYSRRKAIDSADRRIGSRVRVRSANHRRNACVSVNWFCLRRLFSERRFPIKRDLTLIFSWRRNEVH